MLIEKPRCNFKNCRYCFDGNCYSADKYENCKVTDLHSEIAKLTVDLDNEKTKVEEMLQQIDTLIIEYLDGHYMTGEFLKIFAELKKKYTEELK